MGKEVPCTFMGLMESQNPTCQYGEPVNNHDEQISNLFAQPDVLARGETAEEFRSEGHDENVITKVKSD